jgi:hypothetical protein
MDEEKFIRRKKKGFRVNAVHANKGAKKKQMSQNLEEMFNVKLANKG